MPREDDEQAPSTISVATRKDGLFHTFRQWLAGDRTGNGPGARFNHEKRFRIPTKVDISKHWVKDDISDLMETFNEMSDELLMQYAKLDDRVKRRTAELEQSKKAAEAANESKTMFVANVSHELKTPLNGILGMCATSIEEDDVQQMKTSLSIIYKSGDLLLRTLNDLLTFSSNQVGNRELTLEEREFTLEDLEWVISTTFQSQATEKSIRLSVQYEESRLSPGAPSGGLKHITLWGDIHRILQVIINLVSNSLKYTPSNGSVTVVFRRLSEPAPRRLITGLEVASARSQRSPVSARRKSVHVGTANFINPSEGPQLQERSIAPPGNDFYIEFEVQDSGQGVPEDMQDRIFEPFVQGEVGLNRRHSGTGLGLSICSQLASLMKGTISLKSTVGEGSTFTVKIPLRHVMSTPTTRSSGDAIQPASREVSSTDSDKAMLEKDTSESGVSEKDFSGRPMIKVPTIPTAPLPSGEVQTPQSNTPGSPMVNIRTSESEPANTTPATPNTPQNQLSDEPRPSTSSEHATAHQITTRKERKHSKDTKAADKYDFSRLRVLVAEDNKVNQQVILRMLKMEEILQVTIAEDGQQALDFVTGAQDLETKDILPYDLIFMDIQMPVMDGLTSARLIRESGSQIPICALTAYAEQKNIDDCRESGMNHFLAKPLRKPQLHEALIKLCSTKTNTSEHENSIKLE